MNTWELFDKVKPFLDGNQNLLTDNFDKVFSTYTFEQQAEIIDKLAEQGVTLVEQVEIGSSVIEKANAVLKRKVEPFVTEEKEIKVVPMAPEAVKELSNEALCKRYQAGDELALHYLVENNERLVYSRVKRYLRKYNHRLELEDLFSYGLQGILDAAKKFDTNLDNKFTTYCTFWIDQRILRAICDYGFTIRVPVHVFDSLGYILRCQYMFRFETEEELIKHVVNSKGWSEEKVISLLQLKDQTLSPSSLNTVVGEDNDSELIDFVEDDHLISPVAEVEKWMLRSELEQVFQTLTDREAMVLKLRFGLDGGDIRTLEEIGTEFGLTRERIRQIEAKALRKLRHPSRSRRLMAFGQFDLPSLQKNEQDERRRPGINEAS